MTDAPRQGDLFELTSQASEAGDSPELEITAPQLRRWQQRVHAFQAPLFHPSPPDALQGALFGATPDPLADFDPLQLKALPLSFWRWPQGPHHGAALYLVMDRPADLEQPLLLYIGETIAADRRWKGAHDCKAYLAAYQEACMDCGLHCSTSIRFWSDVPRATRARRQLEQTLIHRWQPPFNKETRERWATPFQAA